MGAITDQLCKLHFQPLRPLDHLDRLPGGARLPKLGRDVAGFRAWPATVATALDVEVEWMAAKLASVARQVEFIQSQWCNDGDPVGLGENRGPLVGASGGSGKVTINGDPPGPW